MILPSRVVKTILLACSNGIDFPAVPILKLTAKRAIALAAWTTVFSSGLSAQTVPEKPYYLRFGGVVEYAKDTRFQDIDCSDSNFRHTYGCGTGSDGNTTSSFGEFGTAGGFEIGFGYRLAPGFRLEGIVQSRPAFKFKGHSNHKNWLPDKQPVSAEVSTLSVMTAVFFDFAETISMPFGDFRPYFGSGVGFSRNEISETKLWLPSHTTTIPSGRTNSIATFFSVGILMPISEVVTLDIAWRYTDLGRVESGPGTMYVDYPDDRPTLAIPNLAETRGRLSSSGLAMSLIVPF